MTPLINFYSATLALGGAVSLAVGITSPSFVGAPLAFVGGGLAGAAAIEKRRYEEEEKLTTAGRVTGAFRVLYEQNRGIVSPTELAIYAGIDEEISFDYLKSLSEDTNGQTVQNPKTGQTIFSFPHSANVLDELSKNAQDWAQSQVQAQSQQSEMLARQLDEANQIIRAAQMAQATAPRQTINRVTNDDLWAQGE
jgi:hypothetical protein